MKLNNASLALPIVSAAALLVACGGSDFDVSQGDGVTEAFVSEEDGAREYVEDENGTVLGTSSQAQYFPICFSAASDPDGDGWGWEFNRSCIVNRTGSSSGSSGGSSCANQEGTASTMAAIAVSAAMEMGRWQPTRDFAIVRQGWDEYLAITGTGKSRCADGRCANTQALLDFQKDEANNKVFFPGGVALNSPALRSRLVAKFRDQLACEMQPANGNSGNCPVEEHKLTFQRSEKGGCDTNFFFLARKPDGSPLQFPAQLKNKLLFADRTNPYIGFQSVGEMVSIDPTWGLNEEGSSSTGSCSAACLRISVKSDLSGQCCSCNGRSGTLRRAGWSGLTYLCQ